jgi:hypothetical protein
VIVEDYIEAIQIRLLSSLAVESFSILRTRAALDGGYIRARLILSNGDFFEVAEFFIVKDQSCLTESYRYQWMDSTQTQLRKRWDNVKHFPGLPNFPHHVHILEEGNVLPSRSFTILEILDQVELELI